VQGSRLRMIELLSKVAFSCAQRLVQQALASCILGERVVLTTGMGRRAITSSPGRNE
jgi:hypothetical protein